MSKYPSSPGTAPEPENQGEGDRKSAKRYNDEQRNFVDSPRGKSAIADAGKVDPKEQKALEEAERAGLKRAKEEDPAVLRRPKRE